MYPEVDFLYLNEQEMIKAGVKNMPKCIDTMEDVLKCLTKGDFVMGGENHNSHGCMVTFPNESPFPNMPKNVGEDRRFMAMPAYIGGPFDMAGMKWYGSNTANKEIGLPRSILMVMLNDKTTGAPVCLMSGNLLSAYRTGAIPGVGLRHLAPKGAKTGAIYGPGVMGKTSLDAFMATCPELDTLKVKGRGKKSLDSFLEYVKATYPQLTTVTVVDDIETLVRDSDVISFAATAGTDPPSHTAYTPETRSRTFSSPEFPSGTAPYLPGCGPETPPETAGNTWWPSCRGWRA